MSKKLFDQKMEALDAVRSSQAPEASLRKALKDRNNFLVSKAAAVTGELGLQPLIPDLIAAFDRFLVDAVKTDPQCWAKNKIAKALKDLGHDDPEVYLRGMQHFQLEPVWGGRQDTAATMRGACALALVACTLDRLSILTHLVDLTGDPEKPVRVDAVRAIAQVSGFDSDLLLRLKALAGDREPEVTGQCFASLLDSSPREYIPFVAKFLNAENPDLRMEAVAALGECQEDQAVALLKERWSTDRDPEVRRAILLSLGASRQQMAVEFLLSTAEDARTEDAANAITALAAGRFRDEVRDRVAGIVAQRSELKSRFEKSFLS